VDVDEEVSTNLVNFNGAIAFDMVSTIVADGHVKQNSLFFILCFYVLSPLKESKEEMLSVWRPAKALTQ
jgi:hypothetical protein